MCDCYAGHCEECGVHIPIHIGDFSAGREQVKAYCPDHHEAAWASLTEHGLTRRAIVFTSRVQVEDCEDGEASYYMGRWIGHCFVFIVAMPRSISHN